MAEIENTADNYDAWKKKKQLKKFPVLAVCILIILFAALIAYLILQNGRNYEKFLNYLQIYDENPELLDSDWFIISKRAKTADQYLSLLKRLQENELDDAYIQIIFQAREKNLATIFDALYVQYYLRNLDFQLLRDSNLDYDELWRQYPSLMRYYTFLDNQLSLSSFAKSDEILSLIQRISNQETSKIQDYHELVSISGDETFIFLIAMYHVLGNNKESAQRYFQSISSKWRFAKTDLVQKYNEYLEQNQISIQENINSFSKERLFRDAQSLYRNQDLNMAILFLQRLESEYSNTELSDQFFHFYFWLLRNFGSQQSIVKLQSVFASLQERIEKSLALTLQYLLYLLRFERVAGRTWLVENSYRLDKDIRMDSTFQLIQKLLDNDELVHLEVFLWKKLEAHANNPSKDIFFYWLESMARHLSFFSSPTLIPFLQQYEVYTKILYPYSVYAKLTNQTDNLTQIKTTDIEYLDSDEYPWWHSYNLASWSISQFETEKAYRYLIEAESKLSLVPTQKISILFLSQYIKLSLLEKDFEQAQLYLEEIKIMNPTYPHLQYLEEQINYRKLLSQDDDG